MASTRTFAWLCLLLIIGAALVLPSTAAGLDKKALEDAKDAQENKEEADQPTESKIVKEAEEVDLQSGTGDVSTTGDCSDDIDTFCKNVSPGEGALAGCLGNQLDGEEKGNVDGKKISEPCKKELREFKVERATNINLNVHLAEACKADADKHCGDGEKYPEPGAVITCLREVKEKLTGPCKAEVTETQVEAAKDMDTDALLSEMCKDDTDKLCPDIKPGEGRVQNCLRKKRASLSWDCHAELFRQEVENADDIRLSIVLIRKCMVDKKKFCADVKPGNSRVKECLEENRDKPGFSAECKSEFETMMERRASDFRLDAKLRDLCAGDIEEVCGYEKDSLHEVAGYDGRVIECLQDYRDELESPECKERVHILTKRAAEDIRFDEPMADKCFEDRAKFCDHIPPGNARVIRCLQDNRKELSYPCRASLFDQEVRMAEDIDFQFPMRKACTAEIEKFCKGITHGHAKIIECLQENTEEEMMGAECRSETKRQEIRSAEDYRLNYRLHRSCDADIEVLCGTVCTSSFEGQACGGTMLACLTEKKDDIKSKDCEHEVFNFEKKEGDDWRVDAPLRKACEEDAKKTCPGIEGGGGRMHACLRSNRDKLSKKCREEELKLNSLQSESILLRPAMAKICSEEMNVFCKGVATGRGRMFKCLQNNVAKVDFSSKCADRIKEEANRQASDYRLDFAVKTTCAKDINSVCGDQKKEQDNSPGAKARVLKCLAEKEKTVEAGCRKEVSRAVRAAVWQYTKGGALTSDCDADAERLCPTPDGGIAGIGQVGHCLAKAMVEGKELAEGCKAIILLASPQDAKQLMEGEMTSAMVKKVLAIEQAAGLPGAFVGTNAKGNSTVTLTGWVAILALASLVTMVVGGSYYCYKKNYGGYEPAYTIVSKGAAEKSGDV